MRETRCHEEVPDFSDDRRDGVLMHRSLRAHSHRRRSGPRARGSSTTLPPPYGAANKHPLFIDVDTVQGTGGTPKPAVGCSMTNLFVQGQLVVFRMWGVDVTTGGNALTEQERPQGVRDDPWRSDADPAGLRSSRNDVVLGSAWSTTGYPLGIVNFTVTVISKPVRKTAKHARIPEQRSFTRRSVSLHLRC